MYPTATAETGAKNPSADAGRVAGVGACGLKPRRLLLRQAVVRLAVFALAVGVLFALRGRIGAEDALVLATVVALVAGLARCGAALAAVALWLAAYPPFTLPTYWISLAPLAWIWRTPPPRYSVGRISVEAVVIGFAIAWFSTGFVRDAVPAWGDVAHGFGCFLFGCQLVPLALCARWLRGRPVYFAALACALVGVVGEVLQAHYGVAWSVMSLSLPAAAAPVAQWAHPLSQFGVSGIFFLCSFLCVWDRRSGRPLSWLPPLSALAIAASASASGLGIGVQVSPTPLRFSAMLVQPHWRAKDSTNPDRWQVLDRLTQSDLAAHGPIDLVVWPETALAPSVLESGRREAASTSGPIDLQDFAGKLHAEYQAAGLAGVVVRKRDMEIKYGLEVPRTRAYNCACVVSLSGAVGVQEKLALIPFKEWLPDELDQPWVRNYLLPFFGFEASLSPGTGLQLLDFIRRDGQAASVIAPICYESYLPWLPHYRDSKRADAIIHLTYDGDFASRPECAAREIWACQYRAIETRKWNLICTAWSGSAIIDPVGRVVARLGSVAGVLRTDTIGGVNSILSD